jgi:hypothetical protein
MKNKEGLSRHCVILVKLNAVKRNKKGKYPAHLMAAPVYFDYLWIATRAGTYLYFLWGVFIYTMVQAFARIKKESERRLFILLSV